MKKINYLLPLSIILVALVLIVSCKKDDDDDTKNPYYGQWQSKAYPSPLNSALMEKMVFDFTNTTFEDKVYQGLTADALQLAAGIKGDVSYSAPSTLNAEINEVSIQGSSYIDKNVDETTFNTLFGASLGVLLEEQFTATYEITGDTMVLNLPTKAGSNITIKLGKVE